MASRARTGALALPRFSLAAWNRLYRSYWNNLKVTKWSLFALFVFICVGFCGADSEFSILEEAQVLAVQMKKLSTQELGVLTMQVSEELFRSLEWADPAVTILAASHSQIFENGERGVTCGLYKTCVSAFSSPAVSEGHIMLPAVVKLCCGISYPHVRSMTGLRRAAVAALGQELSHLQSEGHITCPVWSSMRWSWCQKFNNPVETQSDAVGHEDMFYLRQGEEALNEALEIVESTDGWKLDLAEKNGDVIYSKALKGNRKVFRLEAELNASPEELYEILFLRVEEMHRWNPSITSIRVLKQVGRNTMVTHEVSAETAGNLIGQRDFLSVRHSSRSGSCVYLGGAATRFESLPPQSGFVRAEDGPTCIILHALPHHSRKSRFIWLLNMDVKGWLPKSLVNKALPRAQLDFTKHLRHHLTAQTQESRT